MANQPKTPSAREKAAQARAEAEAADKRRRTIINVSIGAVLLVVVAGLIGGAWYTSQQNEAITEPSAEAAAPAGAFAADSPYAFGVELSDNVTGKPVLELWEDFQCPACGDFEAMFGPTVDEIIASGDAQVIFRSTSFLDANFPGDHSKRAAAAFGCAVDAGKGDEFKTLVYANQPATEGDGWTDQQLLAFGEQAGITGDTKATFDKCVTDRTYVTWAVNGTEAMKAAGVPGTPGIYLNGEELPDEARQSPEAFKQAVLGAAKNQ
jgi:protein-disulfide isomerase